jgi:phospholipase C
MNIRQVASLGLRSARAGVISAAVFQFAIGSSFLEAQAPGKSRDNETSSPIKHVIVIIGENRSFDHVFATYVPRSGEKVWNLLSEKIVNADGTPGPNFSRAEQKAAYDEAPDAFLLSPQKTAFPGHVLPTPLVGGPTVSFIENNSLTIAEQSENGLPSSDYKYLVSGGTGQTSGTPDERIKNVGSLPTGPFQLTSSTFNYNDYSASPVHRFYQMWQQLDCDAAHSSFRNPSGCGAHLFSFVETTVGAGTNGLAQPDNFSTNYESGSVTTGEGSTALGFYNVQQGDVPYFKWLADNYTMSDNFHQSVDGGTGANHIMFGHGDMIYYTDAKGKAAVPPNNKEVAKGTANQGTVNEIENPNPAIGTNNWYTEDGYGAGGGGAAFFGGGSYSNCSDLSQPGVAPITRYLRSLPRPIKSNCEDGHYYLLNNYNPGYEGDGTNAYTDTNVHNTVFTIPPSSVPTIGDTLLDNNVSWKYYGDQWNNYIPDPYQLNFSGIGSKTDEYCTICNPFQYETRIMADEKVRTAHIQDTTNLYEDIKNGTLPAVSIVKPSGLVDGHPSSSKLDLFEGFTKKIVDAVQANPELWKDTAIFITEDEGGGFYDSGYVQPLDFFGDGTRIIFLVVSPYVKAGHIGHEYADHVSILKFIERNWGLPTVTRRSRDNFPNPVTAPGNPYAPVNSPAIDDLFPLFDFSNHGGYGNGSSR